jgi:2-amino-4-hydroxy-6-hydroxymethyldihydropteridine diphosphokinase
MHDLSRLVLGLGSNVGPSEDHLRWAIDRLEELYGPLEVAPLYRSAPISTVAQPDFLNTVAVAALPECDPFEVLARCKALEQSAGRRPGVRFGPRPLDVDLLLFGDRRLTTPELELPHPRMCERRFVLAPLTDLLPDLTIPDEKQPGEQRTVRELLERLGDRQDVERLAWREEPQHLEPRS